MLVRQYDTTKARYAIISIITSFSVRLFARWFLVRWKHDYGCTPVNTGTGRVSTVSENVTTKEKNVNVTWADVVHTPVSGAATSKPVVKGVLGNKKFVSKITLSKQSR